jgi:hypothetical protein
MAKGKKTGGRVKGSKNKVQATVKDNIIAVFHRIGGIEAMTAWAENNQTEYFRLYGRLLPIETQVSGQITIVQKKYSIGNRDPA